MVVQNTFKVLFINNEGGGFQDYVEVSKGTTAGEFFKHRMPGDSNPANYSIRRTRDGLKTFVGSGDLVLPGDGYSVLPKKVEGA